MTTRTAAKAGFRPEIQALRAIAVFLVVYFHLHPAGLPGGYAGVDVFFVISGYLITAHLAREVAATGTIRLRAFWARRVRRLLPAAMLVLVAALVVTIVWMPDALAQQSLLEIGASAVYLQNWVLAADSVDYLAADHSATLVQHYWSLSVEEQFYIVWPLLLLAVLLLRRRVLARRGSERRVAGSGPADHTRVMMVVLAVVFVASLVTSIVATATSPESAYFITPTRMWEFAAGGLLALSPLTAFLDRSIEDRAVQAVRSVVAWLGLLGLVAVAFLFTGETPFPGYTALLPVAATIAVIAAGAPNTWWAPSALYRLFPIRYLGDISYSVYLWHWVLIVAYPAIRGFQPLPRDIILIAIATIVLGALSKHFVEDPLRTGRFWSKHDVRSFVAAGAAMALTVAVCAGAWAQVDVRNTEARERIEAAIESGGACFGAGAMVAENRCDDAFAVTSSTDTGFAATDTGLIESRPECRAVRNGTQVYSCVLGDVDETPHVAIMGNSHAIAVTSGLESYAAEQGWSMSTYFKLGCLAVMERVVADNPSEDCATWTSSAIDSIIDDDAIDVVVYQSYFAAAPDEYTAADEAGMRDEIVATWTRLADAGKKVVVLSDVPGTRPDLAPECIEASRETSDPCATDRDDEELDNAVFAAARENPELATAIDLTSFFCDEERCHAVIGGLVVYYDAHHLTHTFSVTLAPFIGARLEELGAAG